MSTMLPEDIEGGRRIDGNSIWPCQSILVNVVWDLGGGVSAKGIWVGYTSLLSSVRRTATPASTLPTVSEISIAILNYIKAPEGKRL